MTRHLAVAAALAVGALAAACGGADDPAAGVGPDGAEAGDPPTGSVGATTAPPTAASGPATTTREVLPTGFATTAAVVVGGDGERLDRCLLVADTPELRARGLMEVTSLGAADGMVFVFPDDTTTGFWMRNTVLPLSIAFLDASGAVVSTTDMDPCPDGEACPSYPPAGPYRLAVEVPRGELASFGLVDDARLELVDAPC